MSDTLRERFEELTLTWRKEPMRHWTYYANAVRALLDAEAGREERLREALRKIELLLTMAIADARHDPGWLVKVTRETVSGWRNDIRRALAEAGDTPPSRETPGCERCFGRGRACDGHGAPGTECVNGCKPCPNGCAERIREVDRCNGSGWLRKASFFTEGVRCGGCSACQTEKGE